MSSLVAKISEEDYHLPVSYDTANVLGQFSIYDWARSGPLSEEDVTNETSSYRPRPCATTDRKWGLCDLTTLIKAETIIVKQSSV